MDKNHVMKSLARSYDASAEGINHVVGDPRDIRNTQGTLKIEAAARGSCGPGRGADEASALSNATVLRNRSIKLSVVV